MNIAQRLISNILSLGCFLGCLMCAGLVLAQDDPFNPGSGGGDPFGDEQAQEAPAAQQPIREVGDAETKIVVDNPAIDVIRASNPQTAFELIRVIDLLLNIDRDDLAKEYVTKLTDLALSDEQNYQLYKQAGSDVIFRLSYRTGLGPEGAAMARGILDGADRYATDGTRIATLTEEAIRNEDKYKRSLALSDLRILSDAGAAVLIEKLVDPNYAEYWPRIRQAVGLFGSAAEGPLMAAMQSNSLKLRVEALSLMGNLKSTDAVESLMLPMLSNASTQLQRKIATRSISQILGRVPDSSECQTRLFRAANEYLMDQVILNRDADEKVKWWRWDAESRTFTPTWLTARTVARIRGFQRAKDLIELNPGNEDYRRLYWVARLETAKMTAGMHLPLPKVVINTFTGTMNREMAPQVLNLALKLKRIPAAVAACEVMGAFGHPEYMESEGGTPSALVRALSFGSVRLKNAACSAISKIDPEQSFSGSSDYLSAMVFLSRSTGSKTALVGHYQLETAQSIAALTGRSGYSASPTTSAHELFERAKDDPDLQLIVVTDKLSRPGFSELVQALRGSTRTSHVPILLMVDPESFGKANRLADRYENILVSPLVANDLIIARQISNLNAGLDYEDATQAERTEFAVAALQSLGRYASQPERYPFFDLVNQQELLIAGLASPANAANTCKVLGELGTAEAQSRLLDTASNLQLPIPLRKVAAESFRTAVKKSGLMMSRQQILDQYSRYNASASESVETQQILGALLDAIEKKGAE